MPVFSGRITLFIGENSMKIRAVVFEFFMIRGTDRRGGGLCFIICIDIGRWFFGCPAYQSGPGKDDFQIDVSMAS